VIAGVDWVTANHIEPAVANMSLGGGASTALDNAVQNSIAAGVSYAVAAGNETEDACTGSPSRVAAAMTIGATDNADRKASFSDFGSCVDWFAPGVNITSAWFHTNTSTNTISGTSMATPHTAGVAAQYLQGNPGAAPAAVRDALFALTTKGIVTAAQSANNHLLFTNF
jgi:aqualysin 1